MPHNVDFHAVTGPGGGSARLDTAPGATSHLRVTLLNPGTFLYHCAFPHVPTHIAHGMYGLIVVEPEEGLAPVDHEYYLMQSEFYTTRGGSEAASQLEDAGHLDYSIEHGFLEEPTFVVFNGRPNAITGDRALGMFDGDTVGTGETVRLYVGNAGPNLSSSFHVIGEIFDTVYVEGSFALANHDVQTTLIPAGGAAAVEFGTEVPGDYLLVDHAIFRTDKGAAGILHVQGPDNPAVYEPFEWSEELRGEDTGH
jgi:nitrite reductase (NO-forming)